MAYYTIDVEDWVRDEPGLSEKGPVLVSVPAEESGLPAVQQLRPGQRVVIFGDYISPESAPIAIPGSGLVTPLGGANGILDVAGDVATARG